MFICCCSLLCLSALCRIGDRVRVTVACLPYRCYVIMPCYTTVIPCYATAMPYLFMLLLCHVLTMPCSCLTSLLYAMLCHVKFMPCYLHAMLCYVHHVAVMFHPCYCHALGLLSCH